MRSFKHIWSGLHWDPAPQYLRLMQRMHRPGDEVWLGEDKKERSKSSHDALMAEIRDYWENLPEYLHMEFPSDEHLRKRALIVAGYCDMKDLVLESEASAERAAALIGSLEGSQYALVQAVGCVVRVYTARSMKMLKNGGGMDRRTFQEAKDRVLHLCANAIGLTSEELKRRRSPSIVPRSGAGGMTQEPDRAEEKEREPIQ